MRFVQESRIAAAPAVVFGFHESRGAIERLSPPDAPVEILAGGDSLQPGSRVVLKLRWGPFPISWVAEHTEYESGRLFADRQIRGPFAAWHHRHLFLDDDDGGTVLRDEVEYALPLGWVGRLVGARFIETRLRRIFAYRHETTRRLIETVLSSTDSTDPGACNGDWWDERLTDPGVQTRTNSSGSEWN